MKTRLAVLRHGETDWNVARRIQGQTDIGLNAHGQRQARAAASFLRATPATAIYSSDLSRAAETAQALASVGGLQVHAVPEMRERHYGMFEGLTYHEAQSAHPEIYERFETRDPGFAFPRGGESLEEVSERASEALMRLAERHTGEVIYLVTHGGVLDVLNRFVRGLSLSAPRDFTIPNAGLNWLEWDEGHWRIVSWGETAHLDSALDELSPPHNA